MTNKWATIGITLGLLNVGSIIGQYLSPIHFTTGDFNKDGIEDIMVERELDLLPSKRIYLGQEDGTYAPLYSLRKSETDSFYSRRQSERDSLEAKQKYEKDSLDSKYNFIIENANGAGLK